MNSEFNFRVYKHLLATFPSPKRDNSFEHRRAASETCPFRKHCQSSKIKSRSRPYLQLMLTSDLTAYPTVREASFYEKLPNHRVKCSLCERRCKIPQGSKGFCRTRVNIKGKLYTLVYGDIASMESRPIEIKPFFHYWPGSTALT